MTPFTREWLDAEGFEGFVPFSALPGAHVPQTFGVYVILRASHSPPEFRPTNPAGRFKGRDPSVTQDALASKWVDGAPVVYIGKAETQTLRKRLDQYRRFGAGEPIGHWGGRYIWQLTDAEQLLVAWQVTPGNAGDRESELIQAFERHFGRMPFANLKRGRRAM